MTYLEYIHLVIAEILRDTHFICSANHNVHRWSAYSTWMYYNVLHSEISKRLRGQLYITHNLRKTRGIQTSLDVHKMYRVFILNSIAGDYAKANNLLYKPKFE